MVSIEKINDLTPESLNTVYKDFANDLGMDIAIKLYQYYKGLQITFPQRLLSREYVKAQVQTQYDGANLKFLARKYGYTERVIRDWLAEGKKRKFEPKGGNL